MTFEQFFILGMRYANKLARMGYTLAALNAREMTEERLDEAEAEGWSFIPASLLKEIIHTSREFIP